MFLTPGRRVESSLRVIDMATVRAYRRASTPTLVGGVMIFVVAPTSAVVPTTLSEVILTVIGLSTGVGVIIGALMIRSGDPRKARIGAVMAVAFGIASVIAGAGFIIGLALSVLGGLIALLER